MASQEDPQKTVDSLNMIDLSIEELEARLELAHPVFHPDGYKCGTDCTMFQDCGGHTSPLPL